MSIQISCEIENPTLYKVAHRNTTKHVLNGSIPAAADIYNGAVHYVSQKYSLFCCVSALN